MLTHLRNSSWATAEIFETNYKIYVKIIKKICNFALWCGCPCALLFKKNVIIKIWLQKDKFLRNTYWIELQSNMWTIAFLYQNYASSNEKCPPRVNVSKNVNLIWHLSISLHLYFHLHSKHSFCFSRSSLYNHHTFCTSKQNLFSLSSFPRLNYFFSFILPLSRYFCTSTCQYSHILFIVPLLLINNLCLSFLVCFSSIYITLAWISNPNIWVKWYIIGDFSPLFNSIMVLNAF